MSSRRTFPTKFVWDHGGQEVNLCITKPEGKETVPLNRSDSGTFEITTNLGQGRYEYCFCVDGSWTHDPDLPAIKTEKGHYSNMLKIVDPKINFSNKAAKVENRNKVEEEGGIHSFVEKCFSDATIHEMMERENVKSLNLTSESEDDTTEEDSESDFPDLDSALAEALDVTEPKFIAESPLLGKNLLSIQNVDQNLNVSFGPTVDNVIVENNKNNQITITAVQKPLERKNKVERNTEVQHFSTFEQPVKANENEEKVSESNNQETIQKEKKNEGNVSSGNEDIAKQDKDIEGNTVEDKVKSSPNLRKTEDPIIKHENNQSEIGNSSETVEDEYFGEKSINDITAKSSQDNKEINVDLLGDKTSRNCEVDSPNLTNAGLNGTRSSQNGYDEIEEDKAAEDFEFNDEDQTSVKANNVGITESSQVLKVNDGPSEDKASQDMKDACPLEEKSFGNNEVLGHLPIEKATQESKFDGEPLLDKTFQNPNDELREENKPSQDVLVVDGLSEEKPSQDALVNCDGDLPKHKPSQEILVDGEGGLSEKKTSQDVPVYCDAEEKPCLVVLVDGDADLSEKKPSQDVLVDGEANLPEEKLSQDILVNGNIGLPEEKSFLSEEICSENVQTSEIANISNTQVKKETLDDDLENHNKTELENVSSAEIVFSQESLKDVKIEGNNEVEIGSSDPGEAVTGENKNSPENGDFPGAENTSKSPLAENVNDDEIIKAGLVQDVKQNMTPAVVIPAEMTNYVTEGDLENNKTETQKQNSQILSSTKDNNLTDLITDQDSEIAIETFEREKEIRDIEGKRTEKLPFIETDLDSFILSDTVSSSATAEDEPNVKISEASTSKSEKPPFIETDLDSTEESKIPESQWPETVPLDVDAFEKVVDEKVTVDEEIPQETMESPDPTSEHPLVNSDVAETDNSEQTLENEPEMKTVLKSQKIQAADINGDLHISDRKNDNNVPAEVKENIIEMNNSSPDIENGQKLSKSVEAVNDPQVMLVEERQDLTMCDHQTNTEGNEEKLKFETSKLIEQNIIEFQESNKTGILTKENMTGPGYDVKTEKDIKLDNNSDRNKEEVTIHPANSASAPSQVNDINDIDNPAFLLNDQKEEASVKAIESSEDLQENPESNDGEESKHLSENGREHIYIEEGGDKSSAEEKSEEVSTLISTDTIRPSEEMEISRSVGINEQVSSQDSEMISNNHLNNETSEEIDEVAVEPSVSDKAVDLTEVMEVIVIEEKSQESAERKNEEETIRKEENNILGNAEINEVNVEPTAPEDKEPVEKPSIDEHGGETNRSQLEKDAIEEKNKNDSQLLHPQENQINENEDKESKEYDKLPVPGDFPAATNDIHNPEGDHSALDETNDKADQTENTHQICLINIQDGTNDRDHVADVTREGPQDERAVPTDFGTSKDLFRQVNNTMYQIERSKSTAGLKSAEFMEIQKSSSKSEVKQSSVNDVDTGDTDSAKSSKSIKDKLGAVKDKVAIGINKVKDNFSKINNKKDGEKQEKQEKQEKLVKSSEKESKQSHHDLMEQRRLANKEKMELMKMSKKLDEVFGVIRTEPVEEIKTEITVRGMGNINLKRGATKKTEVEHNKMDQYDQKRASRQQISMPDKPATFKKPPKAKKEESPKTVAVEEAKPEPPPPQTPKTKKSNFMFIPKPPTPPKEPTPPPPKEPTPEETSPETPEKTPTPSPPEKSLTPPPAPREKTPDLTTKFWPTTKLPTPVPVVAEEEPEDPLQLQPEKPLKVGINGFDRIGRLAFRAALESGMDIGAINDPFIPLHYMVYSLKFDMAHSKTRKKEMTVIESPSGHLIVNDRQVSVFKEVDPRKIPWNTIGVNYVIEATESLQSKVNARHHMEPDEKGLAMKELVNKKEAGEVTEDPETAVTDIQCTVKKVVVANGSSEFPSFGIGVNDDRLSKSSPVICSMSAQANALVLPLKIIHDLIGIQFCSYTLMKAIMGPSKDIKCPTLGPSSHRKTMKWDFSENLVPAPCPVLEEEVIRHLPAMRGKLHGMVVYTPVPEVSMFDLTIHVNSQQVDLYDQVCEAFKSKAAGPLKHVLNYRARAGEETSASGIFSGSSFSVIFDERSGCQIDQSTLKIVLWFDNEHGFANRLVDLVKKSYDVNCNQ